MPGPSIFFVLKQPFQPSAGPAKSAAEHVWRLFQQLDQSQWLSPEELERLQLERFRHLMAHCLQHVPYYRESFRAAGIEPRDVQTMTDFRRLPLLMRRTYQERFPEFCSGTLPVGMRYAATSTTSGTSGLPVEVRQTDAVGLWWVAFYLRDLEWSQIDPRGKLASIRAITMKTPELQQAFRAGMMRPCWQSTMQDFLESGPSFGMDLAQEGHAQLSWLRRIQPDYLLSSPTNLDYLACLLEEEGQPISSLKAIQAISETLHEDVQQRIESAFVVPVKNLYSCVEAGYLASPCPEGHGLHVHSENVILEVLDDDGQPCAAGQSGRVVLTTLRNYLTPFIRYEILDAATPGPERCSCGRGLPLLARVDGKRRPMFWLSDVRRKNTGALVNALGKLKGMRQRQIVQTGLEAVTVRVVPGTDWTAEHSDRVRQLVTDFFERPIQIEVQLLKQLERPARGKLLEVINELERSPTRDH